MSARPCPRLWQVEAARDGRLVGNELASALRHRTSCAECSLEARSLAELGQRIAGEPRRELDALTQRRARQRLLAAWNEQLIGAPALNHRRRVALACALVAAVASAFPATAWLRSKHVPAEAKSAPSKQSAPNTAQSIPIALSSAANLGASAPPLFVPPANAASAGLGAPPGTKPWPPAPSHAPLQPAKPAAKTSETPPDTAEDEAYLHLIDLLRNGRDAEARAQASAYIARFPNAFRRLEVQRIVAQPPHSAEP